MTCRPDVDATYLADLVADLNQAWARYFNELEARRTMTFFAEPHVVRGVAAQGWEYLLVKRGVGKKGSRSSRSTVSSSSDSSWSRGLERASPRAIAMRVN